MKKGAVWALLLVILLVLGGCAAREAEDGPAPSSPPASPAPTDAPSGAAADAVNALLSPYRAEMERVAPQSGGHAAYAIPEQVLGQMSRDAQAVGAEEKNGRWQFSIEETGEHIYQSSAMDLYESDPSLLSATPEPGDETPQDRQLMGDYETSGGGAFGRVRSYDAAADLSSGQAEFTDTLNGETTGHERFSFALRDGKLYFVDAAMDLTADLDTLENLGKYLVAAGYLSKDGLDVIEYETTDVSALPDPHTMDYAALLASVTPLDRISDQNGRVTLYP